MLNPSLPSLAVWEGEAALVVPSQQHLPVTAAG